MKKTLMGLAILPFLAGTALAGQPLTDKQMDKVTAGHDLQLLELTNSTFVSIAIDNPVLAPPTTPPPGHRDPANSTGKGVLGLGRSEDTGRRVH
jgi:hypothetical protein